MGLNFVGSVVVDEEGNIYVADVFNRRIQEFDDLVKSGRALTDLQDVG